VLPKLKYCAPSFSLSSVCVSGSRGSRAVRGLHETGNVVGEPASERAVGLGFAEFCQDTLAEFGKTIIVE
jgi:hypothetical protein